MLPDYASAGHPGHWPHFCCHLFCPLQVIIAVIIHALQSFCRPKVSKDGKDLPKKMKRLVVIETPEDYKGFDDLKDFKVTGF